MTSRGSADIKAGQGRGELGEEQSCRPGPHRTPSHTLINMVV